MEHGVEGVRKMQVHPTPFSPSPSPFSPIWYGGWDQQPVAISLTVVEKISHTQYNQHILQEQVHHHPEDVAEWPSLRSILTPILPESKGRAASVNVNGVNNIKWQEAEGEQGRGRISELAETLNQMEANIAEVTLDQRHHLYHGQFWQFDRTTVFPFRIINLNWSVTSSHKLWKVEADLMLIR